MTNAFTSTALDNGLRIVIEHMPDVKTTAAGFLVRTGARDEDRRLAGVSHFFEHMCFKGTPKRSGHQLNVDFDALGGHPNAFTSQERTFFYGVVRSANVNAQIEILADMMQSTLPPEEFDVEKNVVLEEIAMSNDRLEHVAFDFILERVYEGHSLSWPVLGYDPTVRELTRDQMHEYFHTRYAPGNMVLIAAGSADPQTIIESAKRYCGGWRDHPVSAERVNPPVRTGTSAKRTERFNQQMVVLVYPAPSSSDPLHETAQAVASILGGDNSRFYWNIIQTGLSSRAGAWRLDYADTGLLILSGQCDPENAEKLLDAMRKEAAAITRRPVDIREIERVRNRRRTSLAVEGEAPYYRVLQMMDDLDTKGRPQTVEERLAAVDAINFASIGDYLQRYPIDGDGYLISVGPRDWPPLN